MDDIRMEDWYWTYQHEEDAMEAERAALQKKRQRFLRFLRAARKVLAVEAAVIGVEALYHFGSLIRGYDSIGGEALIILALIGVGAWKLRETA